MTLLDAIQRLYEKYGYFEEKTINLVMPGLDGVEKMTPYGSTLPHSQEIGGVEVIRKERLFRRQHLGRRFGRSIKRPLPVPTCAVL